MLWIGSAETRKTEENVYARSLYGKAFSRLNAEQKMLVYEGMFCDSRSGMNEMGKYAKIANEVYKNSAETAENKTDGKFARNNLIGRSFPPYNEGLSEANERTTRWAKNKSVETGAQALISYHDRWYLIEKFDSADFGYQIVSSLTETQYRKFVKENENVPDISLAEGLRHIIQSRGEASRYGRKQYSIDAVSDRLGRKDNELSLLDRQTFGRRQNGSNGNTNNERSLKDRQGADSDGLSGGRFARSINRDENAQTFFTKKKRA